MIRLQFLSLSLIVMDYFTYKYKVKALYFSLLQRSPLPYRQQIFMRVFVWFSLFSYNIFLINSISLHIIFFL